jgi:predicted RNase H-like nuclease (RuvC/YqgF family)
MTDASDFPQIVRRLVASLAKTQYTPAEELLHNQRSLLERPSFPNARQLK